MVGEFRRCKGIRERTENIKIERMQKISYLQKRVHEVSRKSTIIK